MADKPYSSAEVEAAVKLLREDAILSHNRTVVARLDTMEQRMQRMPVQEMTPEEKAAAYDKLMSGQGAPPAGAAPPAGGTPPGGGAPPGTPPPPPPAGDRKQSAAEEQTRSWWGIYQGEGGK